VRLEAVVHSLSQVMRNTRLRQLLLMWLSFGGIAHAQAPAPAREPTGTGRPSSAPVPIELMIGDEYSSAVLVLSKPFAPKSRWGVFHENTLRAFYDESRDGDVAAQTLLTFAPGAGFRVTAGAFYGTAPGVSPTAGVQYVKPGNDGSSSLLPA
jgi:hypothetical protein